MDTTTKVGPKFVQKESASASVTSSANNGGMVQLSIASGHGLSAGDRITVSGHSFGDYNTSARVTGVGLTTLDTDIPYGGTNGSGGSWTSLPRQLYIYRHFTTDGGENNNWKAIRNGIWEGYLFDWTNNRIYVRVPAGTGMPSDGRYSAGWHKGQALDLVSCDYLIVEGVTFEMFGGIEQSGSDQYLSTIGEEVGKTAFAKNGLRLYTSTNVVVRNCIFNQALISVNNNACSLITIEDCDFAQHDWWTQFVVDPFASALWERCKSTSNEDYDVLSPIGGMAQFVVRRCTFTGGMNSISTNTTSGHDDCDIYENAFLRMFEDTIELDVAGGGGTKNGAAWHNTFTNCWSTFSFRPFGTGPFWIIANAGLTNASVFYMIADQGGASGDGQLLIYHNTLLTTMGTSGHTGCFGGGGRTQVINNVYQASQKRWIHDGQSSPSSVNALTTNAFYSSAAGSQIWDFDGSNDTSEAAFLTSAGGSFVLLGNIYGTNPYPNGINNPLASALQGIATPIAGITTIAADASGNPLTEPLALGYFPKWQS
jgi:hypothetical protein